MQTTHYSAQLDLAKLAEIEGDSLDDSDVQSMMKDTGMSSIPVDRLRRGAGVVTLAGLCAACGGAASWGWVRRTGESTAAGMWIKFDLSGESSAAGNGGASRAAVLSLLGTASVDP